MREIKFRAWHIKRKRMGKVLTFLHLDWECPEIVVKFFWNKRHLTESGKYLDNKKWGEVRDFELLQYTGLKDKNGKEIYEGDILEMNGREDSRSEVIYDDKKWARFLAHGKENVSIYMPFVDNGTNLWEVIGNIYENSDLLSQKEGDKKGGEKIMEEKIAGRVIAKGLNNEDSVDTVVTISIDEVDGEEEVTFQTSEEFGDIFLVILKKDLMRILE